MDNTTLLRLALVYGHLLLCVFALQAVLHTDWLVLQSRLGKSQLHRVHRRLIWLLLGLWASGLGIAAIDLDFHFDLGKIGQHPKLFVKLCTVVVLTINGLLLRHWCFPRLTRDRPLRGGEHTAVLAIGAVSTSSWLAAAFFGIARPLGQWPIGSVLAVYATVLVSALVAAVILAAVLRRLDVSVTAVLRPGC